jgi:uncharacterized membrane protein YkvA (DUF1232 family)
MELIRRIEEQELLAKAKRLAAKLPFIRHVIAMWSAMADPSVPLHVKARLVAALAYFVMPFDVVPDFLVGIGYVDDAAVIMATLRALRGFVTEEHYAKADALLTGWRQAPP